MDEKDFLKFYSEEGLVCDIYLWKKFFSYAKDEIKFLGISYQNSPKEKIRQENSKYYISEINKKVIQDSNNYKDVGFQFDIASYHGPILKLWRELLKDAIVYLKKEDKREKYHDRETFGIDELFKYFKLFIEFEEVLYENIEFYRDHVLHVLRVFLLGLIILFEKIGLDELKVYENGLINDLSDIIVASKEINTEELNAKKLETKESIEKALISNQEKISMWIIISLTHDLGYPLEKLSSINQKVRKMLEAFGKSSIQEIDITFPPQGEFINDFVLRFISSRLIIDKGILEKKEELKNLELENFTFGLHPQSKYWLKFSRSFEEYNHSIISCILLMKYLVYFLESDYLLDVNHKLNFKNQRQFQIRKEILRSIAVHNCEYIYHLTPNNFRFLLTMVDDLQCWGRPSGRITTHGLSWEVRLVKFSEKNIEYTITITESNKNEDIRQIFFAHSKKYTKIFRSGVGGKHRKFDLCFRVIISKEEYQNCKNSDERKIIGLEYFHKVPVTSENYYTVTVSEYYLDNNIIDIEADIPFHVYIAHTEKKNCINKIYKEIMH